MGRWLKPEVYPLIAAVAAVCGIAVFQVGRNLATNPDVRVSKQNRGEAVLENAEEGFKYAEHDLRKFLRTRNSSSSSSPSP